MTLLSYPRSGSTWLRYVFEEVTELTTIGENPDGSVGANKFDKPTPGREVIFRKRNWPCKTDKLIFLIRDFCEAIPRHTGGYDIETLKKTEDYFELVKFFENFSGEKTLIYYEDLVANPLGVTLKLCNFLKVRPLNVKEPNPEKGFSIYGMSKSRGEIGFHSRRLGELGTIEWREWVKQNYNYWTLSRYL